MPALRSDIDLSFLEPIVGDPEDIGLVGALALRVDNSEPGKRGMPWFDMRIRMIVFGIDRQQTLSTSDEIARMCESRGEPAIVEVVPGGSLPTRGLEKMLMVPFRNLELDSYIRSETDVARVHRHEEIMAVIGVRALATWNMQPCATLFGFGPGAELVNIVLRE